MAQGRDERDKCLRGSVLAGNRYTSSAHQGGGPAAFHMADDAVEDAYATAYGEQEYGQQGADGPDAPCSASAGLGGVAGLCPYLFGWMCRLHMAQCYGDISCRRPRLVVAPGPRFTGNEGKTGKQKDNGDGVQRLVQSKGIFDGGCSTQVGRC